MIPPRWSTRGVRPLWALAKAAVLRTVSFCPRLSALYAPRYGARISPVEHAEHAPPFGTRKNALRRWRCSIFFLMPALVQARRGVGMFARWSTRSVRPLWALAKAAVLRTDSFSFVHASLRLRRRQCAQMKNSPWRGCFCSLVPVVGLEPTRILLGRTRTDTDFTPQDFESSASASFTTPAQITIYHSTGELTSVLRSSARERSLCTFHGD